jgi:hypothetical protein
MTRLFEKEKAGLREARTIKEQSKNRDVLQKKEGERGFQRRG